MRDKAVSLSPEVGEKRTLYTMSSDDEDNGSARKKYRHSLSVPFLVEHFSEHKDKWRDIGIALKFQEQDLDDIEAMFSYSFMQRLVEEWLERKHPHAASPTLANLLKALNSHTVGLGTLATEIRNLLHQHYVNLTAESEPQSDNCNITCDQFNVINCIENNKVTLVVESDCESFYWRKTGKQSHLPTSHCNDEKKSITFNGDIDLDGNEFSCAIQCRYGNFYSCSTPVTLRVSCPLDKFKESLASIYLAQPEVPEDSWPPVSNKTYINLALIKQHQAINYGGEYARLTIRGDMDDIFNHKEKIDYNNILDRVNSGSLLLIEGRPGSGKTTLVHKITRDWAASEVQGPMRLVLLISLRVLNSWKKPVTLTDILRLVNLIDEQSLEQRNGKGICFIFDGLDEFSPPEKGKSIIYKIINKKYLPQSIVIVASRPAALVKLRQRATKVIEVIGFPKDQIFNYIENYPFSDISKVTQLKSYLSSHPNVLHMCYLPIHVAMVAFLFEVMGKVPCTETEIYKHFTLFTLMRSLSKHKGQNELEDFGVERMSKKERKLFNIICEIALDKTILNKQVLDQDDLKLCLKSKHNKDISLGLITVDRTAGLYGFKNIYTFLHLTYQEYLAAHHISKLSDEDQHKLIQQYGDTDHMQVVWKFYCGLVGFEGHEYKIKALVHKKQNIGLYDIRCAYESQQQVVSECLLEQLNANIHLNDKYISTSDFTALGYLLVKSTLPIKLSLIECNTTEEAFTSLFKETKAKYLLQSLHYELINDIDHEIAKNLLSHQKCLEHLKLISRTESHSLDYYGFSDIVSTSLANLQELILTRIQIGPKTLSNVLKFCEGLKSLRLSKCSSIDQGTVEIILKAHSKLRNVKNILYEASTSKENVAIDISNNKDTIIEGSLPVLLPSYQVFSRSLVNGIHSQYVQTVTLKIFDDYRTKYYFPKPEHFELKEFQNSPDNLAVITRLIGYVTDFSGLKKLVLSHMYLEQIDTALTSKLVHCTKLRELDISSNAYIHKNPIGNIFTDLQKCSHLQKLVCNHTEIGEYANVMASCLRHWPDLQELDLRYCMLEEEGAKAIVDNFKYCTKLTKLNLRNYVSNSGMEAIESSLRSSHIL